MAAQGLRLPAGKEPVGLKFPRIHIGIKIVISLSGRIRLRDNWLLTATY